MFKIADSTLTKTIDPFFELAGRLAPELMERYAVTEDWEGDLANGVMRLGDRAAILHELPGGECGLLTMMRRYDPQDRGRILQLFEQAAAASSQFCYTTTIRQSGDRRQPIFCIGQSREMDSSAGASMTGIFIFPRFHTEHPLLASQS
ncbi:hypothetical protein [Rhizobium halophytocola]|uniref:PAS domain-containing protein n=1 Tax=Rhizobium halophytocola TaxID=735519 RepID=A0ABS4DXQ5_9HYPH|nr:hypothetical protein [Rhizobium halophytocola]MBP1850465.1 hypothetical protein [Rhizobium halophytocola]